MVFNPNLIVSVLLGILLFFITQWCFKSLCYRRAEIMFIVGSLFLALISLLIPIAYLSDMVGANPMYAQFRSLPYSELLVVAVVPLVSLIMLWCKVKINSTFGKSFTAGLCMVMMLFYISIPFIKPLIRPLTITLADKWQDGVALQTTPSTCGPSSLATIFKYYGKKDSESHIALQAYTSASGTENWYLARYAATQGFHYQFLHEVELAKVPTPAIIGVKLRHFGHFIVLLSNQNGFYEVADPLIGKIGLSIEEFESKYQYTGFVLYISQKK